MIALYSMYVIKQHHSIYFFSVCETEDVGEADAVVGGKIEFRVLDKDRKFSTPPGPTTIVASQTRVSLQEVPAVVPAPPAFHANDESTPPPPPPLPSIVDLPPGTTNKSASIQSSPLTHPEERSIYYDAPPPEDTSQQTPGQKVQSKNTIPRSERDDSYKTSDGEAPSKDKGDARSKKDDSRRRLGVVALPVVMEDHKDRDGESTRYDSTVPPPDTSRYESAVHDHTAQESSRYETVMGAPPPESSRYETVMGQRDTETRTRYDTICDEEKSLLSERRKSLEFVLEEKQDAEDSRKISVINLHDLSAAFQASTMINRSRTVTPSVSPRGTPPHSEGGGSRRSRSSRHRRSCEDLLEEGSEASSKTNTPRPSDLQPRSSISPDQQKGNGSKKSPGQDDSSLKSRIPVPMWARSAKDVEPDGNVSTPSGGKSPRYTETDRAEAARRISVALAEKVASPGNEEDSVSTRSAISEHRSARERGSSAGLEYQRSGSQEDQSDDLADLTPALRRRRQGVDKYVTDETQLNLRFQRRRSRPVSDVNPPPPTMLQSRNRQGYVQFLITILLISLNSTVQRNI